MVKYFEDKGLFGNSAEELEEYFKNAMGYAHHLNDVSSEVESFNHLPSTDEIEKKNNGVSQTQSEKFVAKYQRS